MIINKIGQHYKQNTYIISQPEVVTSSLSNITFAPLQSDTVAITFGETPKNKAKIKELSLLMLNNEIYNSLINENTTNKKLRYLFAELEDEKIRKEVFLNLKNSIRKAMTKIPKDDINSQVDLKGMESFIETVERGLEIRKRKYQYAAFKGDDPENTDELKEFVGDAMPVLSGFRLVKKIADGDKKAIARTTAATVDNIVLQPLKQSAATAAATKGALIGGSIGGPPGALIGGAIGYVGTLFVWGKTRNAVVDSIIENN